MSRSFAKLLFTNTYNRSPWKINARKTSSQWPILDKLLDQNRFTYADYILTLFILKGHLNIPQETALSICHVIMAAREGHLCVKIENNELLPDIKQIWQHDEKLMFSKNELETLHNMILEGFKQIPLSIITQIPLGSFDDEISTPLCQYQNSIYLQRYWVYETIFFKKFINHLNSKPYIEICNDKVESTIQELYQKGLIIEEQAQAIKKACLYGLSIISGGPGTGKTYTAGQIIKILWNNLTADQKRYFEIAVVAPTGKAVANLQKNLSKLLSELDGNPKIIIKTLHSILGIKNKFFSQSDERIRLTADLVIVDESTMVDIQLMSQLFEAIKEGSRVILLGDQHQLTSVEAGNIFSDLIHLAEVNEKLLSRMTELKVCLRAELKSIVDFAIVVNKGYADRVLKALEDGHYNGINHISLDLNTKQSYPKFLKNLLKYYPFWMNKENDPKATLELFQGTRILSPMRKGLFGVDDLNAIMWKHFSENSPDNGWLAIPIMIVTNDYRNDLFNGETGTLMKKLPLKGLNPDDYALFAPRNSKDDIRKISAVLLPKYEYAYCLSVHKSQGSEFDRIILVMPSGSEIFGREIFYTGITRARKQIDIYGSKEVIYKTIQEKGIRVSGIVQRNV